MRRVFSGNSRLLRQVYFLLIQALMVVCLVLAILPLWRPVLYVGLAVALAYTWVKGRKVAADPYSGVRVLILACLVVDALRHDTRPNGWMALTGALIAGLLLVGHGLRVRLRRSTFTANLPDAVNTRSSGIRGGPVLTVATALLVLFAAGVLLAPSAVGGWLWPVLAVVTVAAVVVVGGMVAGDMVQRSQGAVAGAARQALERQAPQALVYFSAPAGSDYQVAMWLPYLERMGVPFAIVTRERRHVAALAEITQRPIVHASTLGALENVIVPSVTTVFYVNNGMKNSHCIRLAHLTHVQLLHGDSDKPPSYSPVTAMYDKIFVAGQAGVDRYEKHGVLIHQRKFTIVGRPQVADIEVSTSPIAEAPRPLTVLYAPTWKGQYADTSLSSLAMGDAIVAALLGLGVRVMFRPHPYSRRDPESRGHIAAIERRLAKANAESGRHLYGQAASDDLTIVECLNASDAMVSDVSSVAADYLYSGKPFAITDVGLVQGDVEEEFPLIRAAYLLRQDADLTEALSTMISTDPLAGRRRDLRAYYLGDFPDEGYADAFVDAARDLVLAGRASDVVDEEVRREGEAQRDDDDEFAEE